MPSTFRSHSQVMTKVFVHRLHFNMVLKDSKFIVTEPLFSENEEDVVVETQRNIQSH